MHFDPKVLQTVLHPPQFIVSVFMSVQNPKHIVFPDGHSHEPLTQVCPPLQAV
jgi:hypothetical protein